MENSEMELFFLSFLLLLTLLLSISLRLISARHPPPPPPPPGLRQPRRVQVGKGSKRRTPQSKNSSALDSEPASNERANIISKLFKTGFRRLIQKLFPFYLRPWTRQESARVPWFLKPQILQKLEVFCDLKEQVTVPADSDERHDRLIVATEPFPNDQKYDNQSINHFLTRFAGSPFSLTEMKLSVRSQDLSWHEITFGSKIHRSAGSRDLLRKFLRGAEKVIEIAITKGGGKMLIQSEETMPMMSSWCNNILNEVSTVVPSSPKAMAVFIVTQKDEFSDPESREMHKNAAEPLLFVDSSDTNVVKIIVLSSNKKWAQQGLLFKSLSSHGGSAQLPHN